MAVLSTKTMILSLLAVEYKTYTSIKHFQNMLIFVYNELLKLNSIEKYEITFNTSFFSVEKTVLCNSHMLDMDEDLIYFRGNIEDLTKQKVIDREIEEIIQRFVREVT